MVPIELLVRIRRMLWLGHALPLGVLLLLMMSGSSTFGWSTWAALVIAVLASLAIGLIGIQRALTPVLKLVDDVIRDNERLMRDQSASQVTTTLGYPFSRLAETHQAMRQGVSDRQQDLQAEFNRLSAVLNSMGDGVVAIDRDERVLLVNRASRTMVHFVAGDAEGRPFLEASRNWSLGESLRNCLATGRVQRREIQTTTTPVRTLSVRASCLPGDPPQGAVAVLHDVTELRRLENLRHEFVANVSHELKTPLAAILAYTETLRLGAINDQANNLDFVGRIEEQAERLHQLIQDILQIARVESGQEVFHFVALPLAEVLEATLKVHRDAAGHKGVRLTVDVQAEATVMADEDGIRTILDNLLSNAIKYTPTGGEIEVRLQARGEEAVIEVTDTGIGIAQEHLSRVFERFFRADRARERSMISTGLGLSIVKHLTQAFGGSVTVTSTLGRGSCFTVTLPRVEG
ncbi:sensor histidine kinase [Roseimaritima sediminicola]|uniref:sensor histidine kinase n=1 Tax=Roseimaritima sediminicola TaxID=2662066 RepID=UPI001298423F|nr:ATP-binding protein [Roseimaritima sediminicola]